MAMGLIIGGIVVVLIGGYILLGFNHRNALSMVLGIVLLLGGAAAAFIGWDQNQRSVQAYTVTEVTAVNTDSTQYRVTLKNSSGGTTWIYVSKSEIDNFQKDSTVEMSKSQLGKYTQNNTKSGE